MADYIHIDSSADSDLLTLAACGSDESLCTLMFSALEQLVKTEAVSSDKVFRCMMALSCRL